MKRGIGSCGWWFCLFLFSTGAWAQSSLEPTPLTIYDFADPTLARTNFGMGVNSYLFTGGTIYYEAVPGFSYALPDARNMLTIEVPFMHNIFPGDFGGYENTTGIGDVRMRYQTVPIKKKDPLGFKQLTFYGELTAPTGAYIFGRGAGTWLIKPGVMATIQASPQVAFYPEVRFQFSASEASRLGGGQNLPNPDSFQRNRKLQEYVLQFPVVMVLESANTWLRINPEFIQSFNEGVSYLFFEGEVGKMLGDWSSASVNISRFIAGQPRLAVIVEAQFRFYLK